MIAYDRRCSCWHSAETAARVVMVGQFRRIVMRWTCVMARTKHENEVRVRSAGNAFQHWTWRRRSERDGCTILGERAVLYFVLVARRVSGHSICGTFACHSFDFLEVVLGPIPLFRARPLWSAACPLVPIDGRGRSVHLHR
jgi:hypothetical protein